VQVSADLEAKVAQLGKPVLQMEATMVDVRGKLAQLKEATESVGASPNFLAST